MTIRRRNRDIVWIALVAAALAVPAAIADEAGTAGVKQKATKALKKAKKANKRSKKALNKAKQPGPAGPEGPQGPQGNQGPQGIQGPAGPGAIWALVRGDGVIVDQSGGIAIADTTGVGGYYVNFGQSVANRALVVSGAYLSGDTGARGTPIAEICGGGTNLVDCTVPGTNNTNHAFVRTFNTAGAGTNHAFYITAIEGS